MTTKYSIKRCNTFGFAQTLKDATQCFTDLNEANIYHVHSSKQELSKRLSKYNATDVQELSQLIPVNNGKRNIIFVELGVKVNKTISVPIEDDDTNAVNEYTTQHVNNSEFTQAIKILLAGGEEARELKEHKFTNGFLTVLIELYPHLNDSRLKHSILDILSFNDYNTLKLEQDHPFKYESKEIETVATAPMFDDIEISLDSNDPNTSTTLYKPDRDNLKKAALGKATQLDAFSENKFAIIHTKKNAGIESFATGQNHDILDTLAVNGVMKSPDTKRPLSVYILMKQLEKFNTFDIIFIHPSYEVKYMSAEYPCEQIIPAYHINQGEILAVVYRYLVVNFFGYCSIFTDSMLEWRYYV